MPLPSDCVSATILICENVLREGDGVVSVIRMVDIFRFKRDPDVPPGKQVVQMHVLLMLKFESQSTISHTMQLRLVRPSGEVSDATGVIDVPCQAPGYAGALRGAVLHAQAPVITKEEGQHWWIVNLDGEEAARAGFTLLEQKADNAEQ